MTTREIIFCCILIGNTIVAILYLIFGLLYIRRREAKAEEENAEQMAINAALKEAKSAEKKTNR